MRKIADLDEAPLSIAHRGEFRILGATDLKR